ncbi:hypothetical protein ACROYT_G031374 [Oculina patagonica]
METYTLLEKLKETIKSDFREFEEKCNEANKKIQHLEKENSLVKGLNNQLQEENASLKETSARLEKELAYKDEKLKRKHEELCRKEQWWSQYLKTTEHRHKAIKKYGSFPAHILEKYVNKDINELMNDVAPDNCSTLQDSELSKKHRNLSTFKIKRKVRYNKVSMTRSGAAEETKTKACHEDNSQVSRVSEQHEKSMEEVDVHLFPDANESTKLYQNSSHNLGRKVLADGIPVQPEILVQETEDVYSEELADGFHCPLGAPSAASTPLAAVDSPLFAYDNDDNDVSVDILEGMPGKSTCDDTVDLLTNAKARLENLPKSDSQFPVDLSYTQPQSPTIPSRTRFLQQDLNLTADCSVSLLPHGMDKEEEQKPKTDSQSRVTNDNDETVFISKETEERPHKERTENCHKNKATKQTTLDAKYLKTKVTLSEKDTNAGKRKRESSDECEDSTWPSKIKESTEEPSKTVFKVPMLPPPKTPEVVLLEEFPARGSGKKSCSTPLSSSGDMTGLYTSGMDLFGNMDDNRSPDLQEENEREQDGSQESSDKENVLNKNKQNDNKVIQEDKLTNEDKCPPIEVKNGAAEPNFKYVEVVRKKDERAKLNGYKCRDCQEYYQGLNLPENELKKRLKHCSRHRAKFSPPPSTPPGFWNLSFPDTQEYMDKGYLKTESQAPAPKRLRKTRRNKIAK